MDRFLTAASVAAMLGVSRDWVYEKASRGEIPSYKLGAARRFDRCEIEAWVREHSAAQPQRLA